MYWTGRQYRKRIISACTKAVRPESLGAPESGAACLQLTSITDLRSCPKTALDLNWIQLMAMVYLLDLFCLLGCDSGLKAKQLGNKIESRAAHDMFVRLGMAIRISEHTGVGRNFSGSGCGLAPPTSWKSG